MHAVIQSAYDRVRAAEKELNALINETFPVGTFVRYSHGNHEVTAEVIFNSKYIDRLKVREMSGKEYWIGACLIEGIA